MAAERVSQSFTDTWLCSACDLCYLACPQEIQISGAIGAVEQVAVGAPRGTLTHHYVTDEGGILQKVNIIVGTTNNYAAMSMSIKRAAKGLVQPGMPVSDAILNQIEMAFRAYDPCLGCATHAMPGETPLWVRIYDHERELVQEIRRD